MIAIELFAGIGGFRLGLERNGINVIWANEWDKYAADTYDKNFKEPIDRRDITTIDVREIPDHDILTGGFPCQAFSIAGKRHGFKETRGTLFFDVARILDNKRPRHFILENVKGLLTHDSGKTFTTILGVLADMGYRVEWQVLNSKDFGVPQNRERVYFVGHLGGDCTHQIFPIAGSDRKATFGTVKSVYHKGQTTGSYIAETRIQQINQPKMARERIYRTDGISSTLNTGSGGGSGRQAPMIAVGVARRGRGNGTKWEARDDGLANTLRTASGGSSVPQVFDGLKVRRLMPVECERLQGFPDDWTAGVSDTQRYRQCGNAVTVNVVAEVASRLI